MKPTVSLFSTLFLTTVAVSQAGEPAHDADRYLKIVCAYADCMIEHGRDTYGKEHS